MKTLRPFHLAFPVGDLDLAESFYGGVLGCVTGRRSATWIDFDFFGHQITAHKDPNQNPVQANQVDGDAVPVRHFGMILKWEQWEGLADKLQSVQTPFLLEPKVRFRGQKGEQGTFFIQDPFGNALEFKSFRSDDDIFDH